jgi:hypothetical protein
MYSEVGFKMFSMFCYAREWPIQVILSLSMNIKLRYVLVQPQDSKFSSRPDAPCQGVAYQSFFLFFSFLFFFNFYGRIREENEGGRFNLMISIS